MPLPTPAHAEEESAFIARFMSDAESLKTFPDEKQRAAVAYQKWRHHQSGGDKQELSLAFPEQKCMSIDAPDGMPRTKMLKIGTTEKQIPIAYFDKDIIGVGKYVNPANGAITVVTPERIDSWVQNMSAMLSDGIDIPVNTDHSESANNVKGRIVKSYRKDNALHAIVQVEGEDDAMIVRKNKSSPRIEWPFIGGNGKNYGDTITHLALTPHPVVPGQGEFVSLSASRGAEKAPIFQFAAPQRSLAMPLTQEQQTKIRELGAGDDITEANAVDFLITKLNEKTGSVTQNLSRATSAENQVNDLKTKLATAESQVQELSRKQQQDVLPSSVIGMVIGTVQTKKERAIEKGGISPACADQIEMILCGAKDSPNVQLLSRTAPGTHLTYAAAVFDAMAMNVPSPKTGTATPAQVLDDPRKAEPLSEARRKELLALG